MVKCLTVILTVFAFSFSCFADTFVNKTTGKTFNGYVVQYKRGDTTQVRVENSQPVYLDLKEYKIQRNYLGRKNKVFTFLVNESIDLESETAAIEKGIAMAANQGPLFILIEIDTPGGRIDLAQRICSAIMAADNCTTIAYISGEKFGGAFSAGAIIALACDKICMRQGTSIGAASLYAQTSNGIESLDDFYGDIVSEKINSAWRTYCSALAEKHNRPGLLVKAMVDKEIEAIEVVQNGKRMFIAPENKIDKQTQIHVWSRKGSLLTLTADEAIKTGIADKMIASRPDVFEIFFAVRAQEIKSRAQLIARRQFESAKKILFEQINVIDRQKKQADDLINQINDLQGNDNTFNKGGRMPEVFYQNSYETYAEPYGLRSIQRVATEIEQLKDQLQTLLTNLIRNYENAIAMTDRTPDLAYYKEDLEKGLKWADSIVFQTSSRPQRRDRDSNWDSYP